MKSAPVLLLLTASALAEPINLDKAPLLDAPGPGYRGESAVPANPVAVREVPPTTWALYLPGDLPAGKRLSVASAAKLAKGSYDTSPQIYLTGDFVVLARAADRVVVRDQREPGLARIVIIYPPEVTVPAEGAKFGRDQAHPLQIRTVEHTTGGVITIIARDIVLPATARH